MRLGALSGREVRGRPPSVILDGKRIGHYSWIVGYSLFEHPLLVFPGWLGELRAPTPAPVRPGADAVPRTGPSPETLSSPGTVRGDAIKAYFSDPGVVARVQRLLDIPDVPPGKPFLCVLPVHEERHPSAALHIDAKGCVVYHDFHARGTPEFLTLPEVYAAQRYGEVKRLSGPEVAVWALRLLVETGTVVPVDVCWSVTPSGARSRHSSAPTARKSPRME